MRSRWSRIGWGVLLGAAGLVGPAAAQLSRTQVLVAEVRKAGNAASPEWFDELGRLRTARALSALQSCLRLVDEGPAQQALIEAFAHFEDLPELAAKALAVLEREALGKAPARARASVATLLGFDPAPRAALHAVLRKARDRRARALALAPLLEELALRATGDDLGLALWSFELGPSGTRDQLIDFLGRFLEPGPLRILARAVEDPELTLEVRGALLEAISLGASSGSAGDAAEAVLAAGLAATEPELQYYALRSVLRRNTGAHARRLAELRESSDPATRRAAHVVLARYAQSESDGGLARVLEFARAADPVVRQAAVEGLFQLPGARAAQALEELLLDADGRVRSAALERITEQRRHDSVAVLIERLKHATGREGADLARSLRRLTAQDHGSSAERWESFWTGEGQGRPLPDLAQAVAAEDQRRARREASETRASFFDIAVASDRVAFLIDTSGSMAQPLYADKDRITVAQEQLLAALGGLTHLDRFAILPFATEVYSWRPTLAACDEEARADASEYVKSFVCTGGTAIFDALERAYAFPGVDTLYVLSDGDPAGGRISDTAMILAEVERWNSTRHLRIHCISIGQRQEWLRRLAESTGGEYRVESK